MAKSPVLFDGFLADAGQVSWSTSIEGHLRRDGSDSVEPATVRVAQLRDGDLVAEIVTNGMWMPTDASEFTAQIEIPDGECLELHHCFGTDFDIDYDDDPVTVAAVAFPAMLTYRPAERSGSANPHSVSFDLLNLEAASDIRLSLDGRSIEIKKLPDYEFQRRLLVHHRQPRQTFRVAISADEALDADQAYADMETLCYLFSLFRGTRIEWTCATELDGAGAVLLEKRREPFAHRFGQLSCVPTSPFALVQRFGSPTEPLGYCIAHTFLNYAERETKLGLNILVDAILDAKSEADFLELRGAKACVALESIVHAHERAGSAPYAPKRLTSSQERRIRRAAKSAVRATAAELGLSTEDTKRIEGNTAELFHLPFAERLQLLSDHLGTGLTNDEILRTVKVRNSLVHTGAFLPREKLFDESVEPSETKARQYFMILDVANRLLLKSIGYDGPYQNHILDTERSHELWI